MDKLLTSVLTAPIATVFIISGILFLFVSVVGNISGKIEPSVKSRIASGILGSIFILIGLMIHLNQKEPQIPTVASVEKTEPDYIVTAPQIAPSRETQTTNELSTSLQTTTDKEPNDHITGANLIVVGTSVRGKISTKEDRDFYTLEALSNNTRVILRKLSRIGFSAKVEVYDAVENKIKSVHKDDDTPVSLSFKSTIGSRYYIVIKHYLLGLNDGKYELVVKKEI